MKANTLNKSSTYALIQKDDVKSRHWQKAMRQIGYNLKLMPGSAVYVPLHILRSMWFYGRPKAVVFRYLNDYPGLVKSVIRVFSELLTICLCAALHIRLIWICHNVDRESLVYRPLLTSFRRRLFRDFSFCILVPDKQLVPLAKNILKCPAKTDSITFGSMTSCSSNNDSLRLSRDIDKFIQRERQEYSGPQDRLLFGWLAGFANWKTAHFERVISLLDASERIGYSLRMIVVLANPKEMEESHPVALAALSEDQRVHYHGGFIAIDEQRIAEMIDFYWRVYRDLSIPLTVYHAAYMKKPILTQKVGFLAHMVEHYELGAIAREDFSDLGQCFDALEKWNPENAIRFLEDHSWELGGRKLAEACSGTME